MVPIWLFEDGMTLCTENHTVFIQKLLELRNGFAKVAGYKIDINICCFLYNNISYQKEKARKIIPFKLHEEE